MKSLTNRFENDVFSPYVELLKAEYRIHPQFSHAKRIWEEKLTMQELVNGPYLEKSQMYAPGDGLEQITLHEKNACSDQQTTQRTQPLQASDRCAQTDSQSTKRCHRYGDE